MTTRSKRLRIPVAGMALCPLLAIGGMEPISDREMSEVTAQAAIAVDMTSGEQADFTRVTFGMEMELQANADQFSFGERLDEQGIGEDVGFRDFALGHIDRESNAIVPFMALDPYVEFAQQDGVIQGVRVGFGQAKGTLTGTMDALSGRLSMQIQDEGGDWHTGQLLNEDGTPTQTRATHYGLPGDSTDCATGNRCVPLSALQTLELGQRASAEDEVGFTGDFFISFQDQQTLWPGLMEGAQGVEAAEGVFLNLPTAHHLDLPALESGLSRQRTEYIDRGQGLF